MSLPQVLDLPVIPYTVHSSSDVLGGTHYWLLVVGCWLCGVVWCCVVVCGGVWWCGVVWRGVPLCAVVGVAWCCCGVATTIIQSGEAPF